MHVRPSGKAAPIGRNVSFAIGDGEVILNLLPINTEDNVLHLLVAIAGLAAGASSSTGPVMRTERA